MIESPQNPKFDWDHFYKNILPSISGFEAEGIIIGVQSRELIARQPGKYEPVLMAVKVNKRLEISYHLGRHIDDEADGDAEIPPHFNDFSDYVSYLKEKVISGDRSITLEGGISGFLLVRSIQKLEEIAPDKREVSDETLRFLDAMHFEHDRRVNGVVLSKQGLEESYNNSFGSSENIALIAIGSKSRSSEMPELAQVQGASYALDDLEREIVRNICNIPSEVLEKSGIGIPQFVQDPGLIKKSEIIQEWIGDEDLRCKELLKSLSKRRVDLRAKGLALFLTLGVRKRLITGSGFRLPRVSGG